MDLSVVVVVAFEEVIVIMSGQHSEVDVADEARDSLTV